MDILPKGEALALDIKSKQEAPAGQRKFYFGAGWDNPNGPVDLDIVAVALRGGKLTKDTDLVYFNNQNGSPGLALSDDNRTGDGDGDDESIVIDTAAIPADVDAIAVGLVAYSATNFSKAPNPHFRACDGDQETSEQIADVPAGSGGPGDTGLVAFRLERVADGWELRNVATFHQLGNGTDAVRGFAKLFG